jgi:hypothetical protein
MLESTLAAITAVSLGKSLSALHTWIVQYLHIILKNVTQALSSWLLIIARQPFSSLDIDFQADLRQTVSRPLRNLQYHFEKQLQCIFGLVC